MTVRLYSLKLGIGKEGLREEEATTEQGRAALVHKGTLETGSGD